MFTQMKKNAARNKPQLLATGQDDVNRYGRFFADIYDNQLPEPSISDIKHLLDEKPLMDDADGMIVEGLEYFTESIIEEIIKEMPRGKAPGQDLLPSEVFQISPADIAKIISARFRLCVTTQRIPTAWKRSIICPVPKKGDLSKIENYRPISLSCTMRRLFENCMLYNLSKKIEPLSLSQNGFRRKRGCVDAVGTLQEWIRRKKSEQPGPNSPVLVLVIFYF